MILNSVLVGEFLWIYILLSLFLIPAVDIGIMMIPSKPKRTHYEQIFNDAKTHVHTGLFAIWFSYLLASLKDKPQWYVAGILPTFFIINAIVLQIKKKQLLSEEQILSLDVKINEKSAANMPEEVKEFVLSDEYVNKMKGKLIVENEKRKDMYNRMTTNCCLFSIIYLIIYVLMTYKFV